MRNLPARIKAWLTTRTGRLVQHDLLLAAAAAAAILEGAHTIDAGVLKTAGVVALKVLLRLILPVPASNTAASGAQIGSVTVQLVTENIRAGLRLGRHLEHDARSWTYRVAAAGITIRTVTWRRRGGPLNQHATGSCTGNAMAGLLMTEPFYRKGRILNETKARELYSKATTLDSIPGAWPPSDTGSSGLAVAKAAQLLGYITGYRHAFGVQDCLAALMAGPVIVGTNWYDGMDTPDATGLVHVTGSVRGGHEYELLGVDADRKLVWAENSWGNTWGVKGRFAISWSDLDRLLREGGDVVQPALTTA